MPNLRAQASMHARQGQTPKALGARERARQDASQARPHAGGHDNPPADRRASVRHAQGLDGQHPLPDQDPRKGQNRDEPAGAGLQYQANDQPLRRQPADAGDRHLTAPVSRQAVAVAQHVTRTEIIFSHDLGLSGPWKQRDALMKSAIFAAFALALASAMVPAPAEAK